jgi:hypothetical protein
MDVMSENRGGKLLRVIVFILCVVVDVASSTRIESSEFSGGVVTGRLLMLHNAGLWLFVSALLVTLFSLRLGAALGLAAAALSAPLFLYLVIPGLFRKLAGGDSSAPISQYWAGWNGLSIGGLFLITAAACICVLGFRSRKRAPNHA